MSNEPKPTLPKCMSIQQVAEHVGVSRRTIVRVLGTGDLEHYRIGARAVIPETAVVKWLESQRLTKNPMEHRRWMQKYFPK
jgi:excisionase family DNA binding protein